MECQPRSLVMNVLTPKYKVKVFFLNVGPPKESIFQTTFYGLYFGHQYTNITTYISSWYRPSGGSFSYTASTPVFLTCGYSFMVVINGKIFSGGLVYDISLSIIFKFTITTMSTPISLLFLQRSIDKPCTQMKMRERKKHFLATVRFEPLTSQSNTWRIRP